MIEKLIKKILEMVEPTIKAWIKEAYKEGYSDAQRHMSEMYEWGKDKGYDDALAYLAGIDIPEVDEELSQTVFGEVAHAEN